jgi:REP element-mobilizing transposase RayT
MKKRKRRKKLSQPLSVEYGDFAVLITIKTANSALWFVNNKALEEHILAYLAKYQGKYGVILYAFVIQGNHIHILAKFPRLNRAAFMRDFNARTAEGVRAYVPSFPGGPLFMRRYTPQVLLTNQDVEKYLLYCALQSVSAGLTKKISEYPGYNSFNDAINGVQRTYKLFSKSDYNNRKRYNSSLKKADCTAQHTLTFSRLPGQENISRSEYRKRHLMSLEQERLELITRRKLEGKGFLGRYQLKRTQPGSRPQETKSGGARPIVICGCKETRKEFLNNHYAVVDDYLEASEKYLSGDLTAQFPPNTYKPPGPFVTR